MREVRLVALAAVTLALVAAATFAQAEPLWSDTVGYSPQTVTPPGSYAFSVDGDVNLGGFVFKDGYPFIHNDGGPTAYNTAVGLNALVSSTPGVPSFAYGQYNTAFGANALHYNTSGLRNTADGNRALFFNTTGLRNIALGADAGFTNTTGSDNIWIGSDSPYPGTASNTLRIGLGTGTGAGVLNRAFISGIRGITTGIANAVNVVIDGYGQLGTVSSSRRVKEDIHDMGDASSGIQKLRPVTFRYKKPFEDGTKPIRYGLIAEEVAEVFPELVAYDEQGRPETVMYHLLDAMFINEIQRQQRTIASQEARLAAQEAELAALRADRVRLDELAARLVRLETAEAARKSPTAVARR